MTIIVISVAITVVTAVGYYGSWSLRTRQIAGYSAFGLNAIVAILGFWTRYRAAWAAYLVVSFLALFFIGVATPIGGLWILMVVIFDTLTHG